VSWFEWVGRRSWVRGDGRPPWPSAAAGSRVKERECVEREEIERDGMSKIKRGEAREE